MESCALRQLFLSYECWALSISQAVVVVWRCTAVWSLISLYSPVDITLLMFICFHVASSRTCITYSVPSSSSCLGKQRQKGTTVGLSCLHSCTLTEPWSLILINSLVLRMDCSLSFLLEKKLVHLLTPVLMAEIQLSPMSGWNCNGWSLTVETIDQSDFSRCFDCNQVF